MKTLFIKLTRLFISFGLAIICSNSAFTRDRENPFFSSFLANSYLTKADVGREIMLKDESIYKKSAAGPIITIQPADAAICPGGSTTFSGSATGGTVAYKWQVDNGGGFVNITDGGMYSNSSTSNLTITGTTVSMYGYKYRFAATNANGTTNSEPAMLTFQVTWTGSVNSNWQVSGNWGCLIVPDASTDVIITAKANPPAVLTNASAHNILINSGSTLTLSTNVTLTITGDITNFGTLIAFSTNTLVNFSGTQDQTIPAITYYNLTAGGGSKTLTGDTRVNGTLSFSGGSKVLLGDNTLTLGSGAILNGMDNNNYIVTNGSGNLKRMGVGTTPLLWPVGSSTSYTPLSISNAGTADNISARVTDNVYEHYSGEIAQGSPISSKVINKTWFLTEDVPGGSNATLTLQWNAADELPGFTRSLSYISHYMSGNWNGSQPTNAAGVNPFTQVLTNVKSFSPFGLGSNDSPLPVKLISFKGAVENKTVSLDWRISDAVNVSHFEIEISSNGKSFSKIGDEKYHSDTDHYTYTDNKTSYFITTGSTLYYRLKMVDLDGSFAYSRIIDINADQLDKPPVAVYPNPFKSRISVSVPGLTGTAQISLTNLSGLVVHSGEVSIKNEELQTDIGEKLPAGIYFLTIRNASAVRTMKMIKEEK